MARKKQNNPLSWDFKTLPEYIFRNRTFRSYLHDQKSTKEDRLKSREKRMRGLTSFIPRKRADTIEKWLPSTEFIVVPRKGMTLKEGRALGEQYRRENKVLVVVDANELIDAAMADAEHQFTPFMMLHDVMECYLGLALFRDFSWSKLLKELDDIDDKMHGVTLNIDAGDEPFHKFELYKKIKIALFLPRISIMHLKDVNKRLKEFFHKSLFRINHGTKYALGGNFPNKLSDVFALWAMNENLTEDQLIFLGDDEYDKILSNPYTFWYADEMLFYEYQDKVRSVHVTTGHPYTKKKKMKIVELLNNLFTGVLQSIKEDGFVPIPPDWEDRDFEDPYDWEDRDFEDP